MNKILTTAGWGHLRHGGADCRMGQLQAGRGGGLQTGAEVAACKARSSGRRLPHFAPDMNEAVNLLRQLLSFEHIYGELKGSARRQKFLDDEQSDIRGLVTTVYLSV